MEKSVSLLAVFLEKMRCYNYRSRTMGILLMETRRHEKPLSLIYKHTWKFDSGVKSVSPKEMKSVSELVLRDLLLKCKL